MLDIHQALLDHGDMIRPAISLNDVFEAVIEFYLVVEVVHLALVDIGPVQVRVVDLSKQESIRVLHFDVGIQVAPELYRDHLGHIIPEAVHPKIQPIHNDIPEFLPGPRNIPVFPEFVMRGVLLFTVRIGKGIEIMAPVRPNPVVELDGFVPVIHIRLGKAGAIPGPFGGVLIKGVVRQGMGHAPEGHISIPPLRDPESLPRDVVKIILP